MPAFLGTLQILDIAGAANVQFGDLAWLSPKSTLKEAVGGSGGATAAFNVHNNVISVNNALETSVIEQPTVGNA
ncbi:spore germination protein [Bacillus sp. FJAT-49736]|uniref:spore germination protein n=1 Tax=Bacillus sp. FJAT-49736 TaxID=2833582 RepID=UPI001BC8D0D4|nr:spore germination protein [Bacillus sp. FJAT-49736]MBS4172245.1 spore germination protein [Bacillus sp. FJAT-49736]